MVNNTADETVSMNIKGDKLMLILLILMERSLYWKVILFLKTVIYFAYSNTALLD